MSYSICLPSFISFSHSVTEILGGADSAPPGCEMGPKSPALLGLKYKNCVQLNTEVTLWHSPYALSVVDICC